MTPDQMAELHAASFTTPRPWSADEIAGFLDDPLVFALTEPGGFLLGRAVAGEAELLTVAVAPDLRGRGIGTRLVSGFVVQARARGAESAFLEVAADNITARSLYTKAGFTQAGKRRGYYYAPDGSRQDALVLVRAII